MNKFGTLLKAHRLGLKVTASQFAQHLGISSQALSAVETGRTKVSPKTAKKYASIAGFSEMDAVKASFEDQVSRLGMNCVVSLEPRPTLPSCLEEA